MVLFYLVHVSAVHLSMLSLCIYMENKRYYDLYGWKQCDQTARLFFLYLANCSNEICPFAVKLFNSLFKSLSNYNQTLKKFPKNFKYLPKWQNFANSDRWGLFHKSFFHVIYGKMAVNYGKFEIMCKVQSKFDHN